MYEIGPDPSSKGPPASTSFPRHEEARPFPLMAPSPPPSARPSSTSPTESRDASGERDANGNFGNHYSTEQSPPGSSGVHPGDGGIFNFPQNDGGGAVRLTHMTPISPTNEDVYSSEQLQRNPQPPISNSFLQVLSPSRPGATFPYLFTGPGGPPIFSMQENEKYRKLMLKKQKRKSKQEKNVLNVFNAEAVVGHIGNIDDIDSVLQSMGEKVEKKPKVKKSKEKNEKTKSEKRERARKSVEKDIEDIEEEDKSEDDDEKPREEEIKIVNKARNKFVEDDLMAFKNNFNLVGPEPGPLTRHKSRDCLAGSVESLPTNTSSPNMSFTKVTSKKHRTKRSKEESGKPPPGPVVAPDGRKGGYALRSREGGSGATGGREQVTSSAESSVNRVEQNTPPIKPSLEIPSLEGEDFPKLVQDDFPALPGGGAASDPAPILPSAWSRAVVKSSDSDVGADKQIAKNSDSEEITDSSNISEDNVENKDHEKDSNACDFEAVIDSTVPSDSVRIDIESSGSDIENVDEEGFNAEKDNEEEEEVTVTKTDIFLDSTTVPDDPSPEEEEGVASAKIDNIEVVTNEDEFNRRKADNSAPVVIFSENDQDWTSAEFTFGFDVNEDLVANSSNLAIQDLATQQPQQMWPIPAPLAPIDTMDGAILSFGGPDSMRMIVPVPVGVPIPVSGMAEHLPPLPFYPHPQFPNGVIPNFRAYGMSFGHQMAPQGMLHQQYQEDELELGEKGDDAAGEDHTISPESGISSASPLSWQPDSSPSLPAPGSYPHNRDPGRANPPPLPLASQVSQSLSNWQGHSVHSDSSESDRSSPAPGWATQVEIEEDKAENADDATNVTSDKTNDSGLSSENSNASLEKDLKERKLEKFNLGEIVSFISSSWSSVSQDSSVSVFSASSHAHTDVTA